MEAIFKKLRQSNKADSFAGALFEQSAWALQALDKKAVSTSKAKNSRPAAVAEKKIEKSSIDQTERVQIIDSLQDFVEEKVEKKEPPVFSFNGGEIASTSPQKPITFCDLSADMEITGKKKILFLNDFNRGDFSDLAQDSYELFRKMSGAMKVAQEDFVLHTIFPSASSKQEITSDLEEQSIIDISKLIYENDIDYVVSFGVIAAHFVLQKKDRLTKLRGQLYKRVIQGKTSKTFNVLPVFHPDFLLINPSMKTTTWNDLQLVMEELKLL